MTGRAQKSLMFCNSFDIWIILYRKGTAWFTERKSDSALGMLQRKDLQQLKERKQNKKISVWLFRAQGRWGRPWQIHGWECRRWWEWDSIAVYGDVSLNQFERIFDRIIRIPASLESARLTGIFSCPLCTNPLSGCYQSYKKILPGRTVTEALLICQGDYRGKDSTN